MSIKTMWRPEIIALLGGAFAVIAAALAAVSTFWSANQRTESAKESARIQAEIAKKSDELAVKSEEIARLNKEIADTTRHSLETITGAGSYCYIAAYSFEKNGAPWVGLKIVHVGKYPLYDVSINVLDLEAGAHFAATNPRTNVDLHDLFAKSRKTWGPGNISPKMELFPEQMRWPISGNRHLKFEIDTTARNGTFKQQFFAISKDGKLSDDRAAVKVCERRTDSDAI
jgi:hypothetical protein